MGSSAAAGHCKGGSGRRELDARRGTLGTLSEEIVCAPEVSGPQVKHGACPGSVSTTSRIRPKGTEKSHFDRQAGDGAAATRKEHGDRAVQRSSSEATSKHC